MPIITIELLEGRTIEQKRQLAKVISNEIAKILAIPIEDISIIFHDLPKTNAAKGGILASELKNNITREKE